MPFRRARLLDIAPAMRTPPRYRDAVSPSKAPASGSVPPISGFEQRRQADDDFARLFLATRALMAIARLARAGTTAAAAPHERAERRLHHGILPHAAPASAFHAARNAYFTRHPDTRQS